jgi:hypothetical protein
VKLGIKFPAVVDNFDNVTERAYTGWPDRLYVIDRDGLVSYKSGPGPFGFKPQGVAETLQRIVPQYGSLVGRDFLLRHLLSTKKRALHGSALSQN